MAPLTVAEAGKSAAPLAAVEPAADPDRPALEIEALSPALGLLPGLLQPSLGIRLRVDRLDPVPPALLAPVLGEIPVGDHRDIVGQLAGIMTGALRHYRFPIVDEPQIAALAEGRWLVRLPIVQGLHASLARLCRSVAGVLDHLGRNRPIAAELTRILEGELRLLRAQAPAGKNPPFFVAAAQAAGIPWQRLNKEIYQFGCGNRLRWFASSISDRTPYLGAKAAMNKLDTAQLLRLQLLPVPENGTARTAAEAARLAERIGYPVVVKPTDRDRGEGVFAMLTDAEAVGNAFAEAQKYSRNIMVEQHVAGDDYRLHVFAGSVYRIRRRTPGGVVGDGRSAVRVLLDEVNAEPGRGPRGGHGSLVRIEADEEAQRMLALQSLGWESVPEDGRFVALRSIANVSTGGRTMEMPLAEVHPDHIAVAVRAVELLGLDIAAVDFICPDITRPWAKVGGAICEINVAPQFGEDAAEKIFAGLFPNGGRIPIGLVIGGQGTAPRLAELRAQLAQRGVRAGVVSGGEAWIGDAPISGLSRQSSFEAAAMLLRDRRVELLIVEVDAGFRQHGVPCDGIDWLAIDRGDLDGDAQALAAVIMPFAKRLLVRAELKAPLPGALPAEQVEPGDWVAAMLGLASPRASTGSADQ